MLPIRIVSGSSGPGGPISQILENFYQAFKTFHCIELVICPQRRKLEIILAKLTAASTETGFEMLNTSNRDPQAARVLGCHFDGLASFNPHRVAS